MYALVERGMMLIITIMSIMLSPLIDLGFKLASFDSATIPLYINKKQILTGIGFLGIFLLPC
jgi:hypothetical protein